MYKYESAIDFPHLTPLFCLFFLKKRKKRKRKNIYQNGKYLLWLIKKKKKMDQI